MRINLPVIKCWDCNGLFTAEIGEKSICPDCDSGFLVKKEENGLTIIRQ